MFAGGNFIGTKDANKLQDFAPKVDTKEDQALLPKESKPKTTEEIVKEYFKDTPALTNIAYCESRYRQFEKDGTILRGKVNGNDVGVMQINTKYHLEKAISLGMDLFTLEGNLAYGKYLYEKQGSAPWNASSPCWLARSNGSVAMK